MSCRRVIIDAKCLVYDRSSEIIIGFIVGVIAKFIMPGDKYEPKGFILTVILGIVGAFVATYLGQPVGWYKPGESARFIGGVVGAIVVLLSMASSLAAKGALLDSHFRDDHSAPLPECSGAAQQTIEL